MKAGVLEAYGESHQVSFVDLPTPIPTNNQVRVKVHATSLLAGDCELRTLTLPSPFNFFMRLYAGWKRPKRIPVLGMEFSGTIDQVGSEVTNWRVGQKVCGTSGMGFGTHAEYLCLPADPDEGTMVPLPEGVSFAQAAVLPIAGLEAQYFLEKMTLDSHKKLLIIGAAGSIGTYTLELAKASGAEIDCVDKPDKWEGLEAMGARCLAGPELSELGNVENHYHYILDVPGAWKKGRKLSAIRKLLVPGGTYFCANPSIGLMIRSLWSRLSSGRKVFIGTAEHDGTKLIELLTMVQKDQLHPQIGKEFSLEEIRLAHQFFDSGGKTGNILIRIVP